MSTEETEPGLFQQAAGLPQLLSLPSAASGQTHKFSWFTAPPLQASFISQEAAVGTSPEEPASSPSSP